METKMRVKEVMSTHLETVAPRTTIQECARRMDQAGVGAVQVWDEGKPVGLVTDRDICCRAVGLGKGPMETTVGEIMTRRVTSCFDDDDCTEAARLMRSKGVRRLIVTNRKEVMVGILSVDDLARCSHQLAGEVLESVAPWPH
jgi:predicted transcriptional regulator